MTIEEAKVFMLQFNTDKRLNPSEHEAVRVAIKVLEQEPCEDCISREDAIKQCGFGMTSLLIAGCLRRLPSVTPQPFINKPCVSEGVCREDKIHVLDKIKEEIKDNTYFINETTEKEGIDFETVEKIINKYKAESEE